PVAVHVALQKELDAGRPRWHEIATTADEVVAIEAWHDDLYLLTHRGATNRRVLRVAAGAEDLAKAKVAVPEGDAVIEAMGLARDGMYLRTMVAGVDRLERMRFGLLASGTREFLRLPYDMAIAELVTDRGATARCCGSTDGRGRPKSRKWMRAPGTCAIPTSSRPPRPTTPRSTRCASTRPRRTARGSRS